MIVRENVAYLKESQNLCQMKFLYVNFKVFDLLTLRKTDVALNLNLP